MTKYRVLLMSGACCLGLVSYQAMSRDALATLPNTIKGLFAHDPGGAKSARITVAEGDAAAEEEAVPASPPAAAEPASSIGVTQYYGISENPDAEQLWAAAAAMNSDYAAAETPAAAEAAAETPAAAEPAPTAKAASAGLAASKGVTQYYGVAETPDSEQAWSAAAAMNADDAADAPSAAVPAAAPAAAETPTPPAAGQGVTQYYGVAEKPDAEQAWAAEASMNPDYSAEAPVPAPAPVAEAPAAAPVAAEAPPPPTGGQGVTQFYGVAEKPDAEQAWSAPATMSPVEAAEPVVAAPAPAAVTAPVRNAAVETCRAALNTAAGAGKLRFATSSWDIDPGSFKTLDSLAKIAKDCSADLVIEVGGHTDNTGKSESNKTISELRAQEVVKYLTGAGVDAAKLKAVGYGQDFPLGKNDTREGRQQNRRIEFLVSEK